MRYNEMDFFSKVLKKTEEYGFLAEATAHLLQQKLKDLHKAYSDAFDKKQTLKIQKLHSKIPNSRKDYLHNISNEISKNHARIYIEDLQI